MKFHFQTVFLASITYFILFLFGKASINLKDLWHCTFGISSTYWFVWAYLLLYIFSPLLNTAKIGDNVYIGPSVCIVENIHIGNNATIGAGAIVVKDVPDDNTVAGNPARVISMKTPGRFIWRRWENKE